MAKTFIQLLRSDDTLSLLEEDHKSFLLLTYICLHACRDSEASEILESGECFISEKETPKKCGLTTKEYRWAKTRLLEQGFLEEIFNPTWFRKNENGEVRNDSGIKKWKKRAIKRAIKSCVVKICKSTVYNINEKTKGDQKGDGRAIKGRSKGDIQEVKEVNNLINQPTNLNLPSQKVEDEVGCESDRSVGSPELEDMKAWLLKEHFRERGKPNQSFSEEEASKLLSDHGAARLSEVKIMIGRKTQKAREKIESEKAYFKMALFRGWK